MHDAAVMPVARGGTKERNAVSLPSINQHRKHARSNNSSHRSKGDGGGRSANAKVLHDYQQQSNAELSIFQGSKLQIVDTKRSDGWWEAVQDGRRGLVPAAYVQVVESARQRAAKHDSEPSKRGEKKSSSSSSSSRSSSSSSSSSNDAAQPPSVKVLFDYMARSRQELSVVAGDTLELVSKEDADWWEIRAGTKTGFVPATYLQQKEEEFHEQGLSMEELLMAGGLERTATVLYEYAQQSRDELTVHEGDIVEVISASDSDWWEVKLSSTEKTGLVPAAYLTENGIPEVDSTHISDDGHAANTTVRALYDYTQQSDAEITIKEGDILILRQKSDADWWSVELAGKHGFVPALYVEEMPHKQQTPVFAMYSYNRQSTDEISICEGDEMCLVRKNDDDWWEVDLKGKTGLVPASYVTDAKPKTKAQKKKMRASTNPEHTQKTPTKPRSTRVAQRPTRQTAAQKSKMSPQKPQKQQAQTSQKQQAQKPKKQLQKSNAPAKKLQQEKPQALLIMDDASKDLYSRLFAFYKIHQPDRLSSLDRVKKTALKYSADETKLNSALQQKYGSSLAKSPKKAKESAQRTPLTNQAPVEPTRSSKATNASQMEQSRKDTHAARRGSVVRKHDAATLLQATYRGRAARKKHYPRIRRGSSLHMPPSLPAPVKTTQKNTPPPLPPTTTTKAPIPDEGQDDDDDIDKLVGHRVKKGVLQIKVRWKGYGPEDDEFFPFDHILQDFPQHIRNYIELHPELQEAYERGDFDTELDS